MDISSTLLKNYSDSVAPEQRTIEDRIIYGTAYVDKDNAVFVYYDGSDIKTPVETSVLVETDDKVMVLLKNHTATVIGNLTKPSDSSFEYYKYLNQYFNLTGLVSAESGSVGYGFFDTVNRIVTIRFKYIFENISQTDMPLLSIPSSYTPSNDELYPITVFIGEDSSLQGYAKVGSDGIISQSISNNCVGVAGSITYKL